MSGHTLTDLKDKLNDYEYVSFDLFDTLMFRTVSHPYRVFEMVVALLSDGLRSRVADFPKQRVIAESKARTHKSGKEVDLNYIYSFLPFSAEDKVTLMGIEKQCELDNCLPNVPMVEVVNSCYDSGKNVIITTDMYLDRRTLESILLKIGVKYHRLFISSEEGVTKRSGELYRIVLKKLGIKSCQLIHIGDDLHNDIEMAMKNHIDSFERVCEEVKGPFYIREKNKNIVCDHLLSMFRQKSRDVADGDFPIFRVGYTVVGPLMYDFCRWVHQVKVENKLEKLLFVAREGFLIKKCYEILFPEEKDAVSYVYLNKNLLRLPMMSCGNKRDIFIESLPGFNIMEWDNLFELLLVKDKEKAKRVLLKDYPSITFETPIKRTDLVGGKYDDIFDGILSYNEQVIANQSILLKEYLKKTGLWDKKVGLVNNSINGSGQNGIETFVKKNGGETSIIGTQFIASETCSKRLEGRYKSYFQDKKYSFLDELEFKRFCLIFEHLLFEPSPTARCLVKNENGIQIQLMPMGSEYNNFAVVESIQKYVLSFIKDYHQHVPLPMDKIPMSTYLGMMHSPQKEDVKLIGNLYDDDIYGSYKLIPDICFSWKHIITRNKPKSVQWLEGFLTEKRIKGIIIHSVKYQYYRCYMCQGLKNKMKRILNMDSRL